MSDWSSDVCSSDPPNSAPPETLSPPVPHRKHRELSSFLLCRTARRKPAALSRHTDRAWFRWSAAATTCHDTLLQGAGLQPAGRIEIGRASCRERVCAYGSHTVAAVYLKTKNHDN